MTEEGHVRPGIQRAIYRGINSWIASIKLVRVWTHLAFRDVRSTYAATRLGPGWSVVSVLLSGVILGFVYARLFNQAPRDFLPFLFSGFLAWGLLASYVGEATNAYRDSRNILLNTQLDTPLIALRYAWRATLTFLLGTPVVVAINMMLGNLGPGLLLLPLALSVTFIFGVSCFQIVSYVTVILPTVRYLMPSIMQLLFLITPVFWTAERIPSLIWLARINPLTPFLDLLRNSLRGEVSPAQFWVFACGWTTLAVVTAILTTNYTSNRFRCEV